jgi:hypothetical protein
MTHFKIYDSAPKITAIFFSCEHKCLGRVVWDKKIVNNCEQGMIII